MGPSPTWRGYRCVSLCLCLKLPIRSIQQLNIIISWPTTLPLCLTLALTFDRIINAFFRRRFIRQPIQFVSVNFPLLASNISFCLAINTSTTLHTNITLYRVNTYYSTFKHKSSFSVVLIKRPYSQTVNEYGRYYATFMKPLSNYAPTSSSWPRNSAMTPTRRQKKSSQPHFSLPRPSNGGVVDTKTADKALSSSSSCSSSHLLFKLSTAVAKVT